MNRYPPLSSHAWYMAKSAQGEVRKGKSPWPCIEVRCPYGSVSSIRAPIRSAHPSSRKSWYSFVTSHITFEYGASRAIA